MSIYIFEVGDMYRWAVLSESEETAIQYFKAFSGYRQKPVFCVDKPGGGILYPTLGLESIYNDKA